VLDDSVALFTATTPSADTVAPVVEPNVVTPVTSNVPPICVFLAIPAPPVTFNAPVVVLDDSVALFTATTPSAETVAPVVEPNVVTPVTSNVPPICAF